MLHDYYDRFYLKLNKRSDQLKQKKYAATEKLVKWREKVAHAWDAIEVLDIQVFDSDNHPLPTGDAFEATIKVFLGSLSPQDVGIEVVFFKRKSEDELQPQLAEELELKQANGHTATYYCKIDPKMSGVYEYGFRLFPKNDLLAHRQDLNLVHWL
jgi:hypothetical protein